MSDQSKNKNKQAKKKQTNKQTKKKTKTKQKKNQKQNKTKQNNHNKKSENTTPERVNIHSQSLFLLQERFSHFRVKHNSNIVDFNCFSFMPLFSL